MSDEHQSNRPPETGRNVQGGPERAPAETTRDTVRTEVVDNRTSRDMEASPGLTPDVGDAGRWPEMDQYLRRFDEIQVEFIEEPRSAVDRAETLVEEAVNRMMGTFRERLRRIHDETEGGSDTERLRVAMMHYREFIDSLGDHRAA